MFRQNAFPSKGRTVGVRQGQRSGQQPPHTPGYVKPPVGILIRSLAAQIEAMEAQRAEDVEPAGAAAARSEQEQEDMAFARQLQEEEQAEQATGSRPDIQIVPNRLEWSGKPFLPSLYVCVPCVRGSVWCHLVGCVF